MSYRLGDMDLPDAPDIARAERYGLKPGELPFEPGIEVRCPICGASCETVLYDVYGEIAGCGICLRPIDGRAEETEEWTEGG